MNELYEKVKQRLSLRDNMYDHIRIIDPVNKNIICISNNEITKHKEKCYDILNRGGICRNCISMRADIEKDTFVKMECVSNKVMLIAATPIKIEKEMYVVEIIKYISLQNNMTLDMNYNFSNNIKTIIDSMNEKIITDDSTGTYNRIYIQEKLSVEENKLSILNYRIQELRGILNQMSLSSEDETEYEQTLKVSQDLDELIVEYMKNII